MQICPLSVLNRIRGTGLCRMTSIVLLQSLECSSKGIKYCGLSFVVWIKTNVRYVGGRLAESSSLLGRYV
jgi:hypothetical protein